MTTIINEPTTDAALCPTDTSQHAARSTQHQLPIPIPKQSITIRPGTLADVPFLDALQKMHSKQVGWMPTKQFEGKIKLGALTPAHVRQLLAVLARRGLAESSRPPGPRGPALGPRRSGSRIRAK